MCAAPSFVYTRTLFELASEPCRPQQKSNQIVSKVEISKCLSSLLKKLYSIGGSKIAGIALLAMVRTALTNYQGKLQGQLFETAFLKRVPDFVRIIVINMGMCVASSTVESTTRYLLDSLAIQWRGWMTRMLHNKYFSHMVRTTAISRIQAGCICEESTLACHPSSQCN